MRAPRFAAVGAAALALAACAPTALPEGRPETLTVLAASSLAEVMTTIVSDFEADHPDVNVAVSFAGSSTLASQVLEGAPADVLATADEATMATVSDELEIEPQIFATNTLTIAVPAGNPGGITGVDSLSDAGVVLVTCAPQVPCGAATALVAEASGATLSPVSEESNVTDVLGKVASGEADAGIVYATDLARADGVEEVALEHADAVVNRYPIAALPHASGSPSQHAREFVAAVLSSEGRAVLAAAGFGAP
ncbi:molybdate ABC transporter substrate-binding protein [Demequina sp. NBRC 110052]|uniref:molybdate ABC transporter substrate-binding protein n=1 Tax=Demequina sp. NBRC 110052 TaxID=1570341 RepID=UPI0009FDB68A|nr:molybdate ABC transporter substrate-binding protein [Demequina sp. NBRC 110052]